MGINSTVQYSNWQLFSEYQNGATPCLLCKMKVLGSCCDLHVTDTTSQQRWIIFLLPIIVFTIHLEGKYGVIPSNISACKSRRVFRNYCWRYQPVWRCALPCKFVLSTPQSFNMRLWRLPELRKRWNELCTQSISTLISYILTLLIPGNVQWPTCSCFN